jgi:hypothetical protein
VKEQKVLSKFWFWGLLILPILLYFLLIELYGMNIPYVDDHGLKGFLVKFQDSKTWTEKIAPFLLNIMNTELDLLAFGFCWFMAFTEV